MKNETLINELLDRRSVEEVAKVFAWLTDSQKESVASELFDEYHRRCAESVAHD